MRRILAFIAAIALTTLAWAFVWELRPYELGRNTYLYETPPRNSAVLDALETVGVYEYYLEQGAAALLGGFMSAMALQLTNRHVRWHHIVLITLAWGLSLFIWWTPPFFIV